MPLIRPILICIGLYGVVLEILALFHSLSLQRLSRACYRVAAAFIQFQLMRHLQMPLQISPELLQQIRLRIYTLAFCTL